MGKKENNKRSYLVNFLKKNKFIIFFSSFLWFIYRTGTKPSRISYPCQQTALANMGAILKFSAIPSIGTLLLGSKGKKEFKKSFKSILVISLLFLIILLSYEIYKNYESKKIIQNIVFPEDIHSTIFIVKDTDGTYQGVKKLLDLMERNDLKFYKTTSDKEGLIGKKDVVLIKVNSQWDERGGTNTDLVNSVIKLIINHPEGFSGEIVIVDNGQAQFGSKMTGGSFDWENNNAINKSQSIQKVVDMYKDRYKVSTYLWDNITFNEVNEYSENDFDDGFVLYNLKGENSNILNTITYPKFKTKYGSYISFKRGIWDNKTKTYDNENIKMINMPVLKPHLIYGVTGAVKNYMGTPSVKLTKNEVHNNVGKGAMGVQISETRFSTLNIMDSIWVSTVYPCRSLSTWWCGPTVYYNDSIPNNMILASTDPVALDYWASKNILMRTAENLGHKDIEELNPDIIKKGNFGYWLRISMDILNKAGYNTTIKEDNIKIINT